MECARWDLRQYFIGTGFPLVGVLGSSGFKLIMLLLRLQILTYAVPVVGLLSCVFTYLRV